ncbi:MAG: hypothetical protein UT24_C0022G0021 [Candidatus Woesebacteria bacterium GW2011_GWB1_39_12]|uniref:Uncharacterized protein n=1 Tax=Candidatus Woesebacteria bacterium GW2011_GWB1_39_12 TaxID=1618574 RepID=A0A0G0MHQ2_9BACT|nr:MAG: hypothetical protein UT24_C0022G0021 [Candidatus Woesebacteria bacterium GW2011_GWB1_39_12]
MTIKELKEQIAELTDEMEVLIVGREDFAYDVAYSSTNICYRGIIRCDDRGNVSDEVLEETIKEIGKEMSKEDCITNYTCYILYPDD